jgi:hypothetical protein
MAFVLEECMIIALRLGPEITTTWSVVKTAKQSLVRLKYHCRSGPVFSSPKIHSSA